MARIAENYGRALYRATAGLEEKDAKRAVARFVDLLAARRELQLAPDVIAAFEAEARKAEGVRDVSVATAEDLTADRKRSLTAAFKKALDADVEIAWKTDLALIAGAVIRYDDVLLDASVKGSLDRLKKSLI